MIELLNNEAIYQRFVQSELSKSEKFLWIGTADIKDLFIQRGKRFAPFLAVLSDLVKRGVEVRLLHAKEPGPRFRRDFDRYPALIESDRFERALCPRVHFKILIVDGRLAWIGSANLTGAGLGARHKDKRNFESGILTDEPRLVNGAMEQFDSVFMGARCAKCRLRRVCPDPIA
jgi:phosphatidylserine/phosphatidylglycerophosphate/cardiolipin synthase-like enzyme